VPAALHKLDRRVQRGEPVDTGLLHDRPRDGVGQQPSEPVRELADRRAVRLHADGVDDRDRAAAIREATHSLGKVVVLVEVERDHAVAARALEPLGHQVDADDLRGAPVLGDPRAHLADRAEAENEDGLAVRHVGVLDGLPRGGQHVGEVDEAVVGRPLRDLDRPVLGLRHPQELGLAARYLAVELGVAEQRRAGPIVADLGGLAL
jgi:hypothetical protein